MGPSLAMVSFFIPQWLRTITVAGEQMQSFVNVLADNENAWLITKKQKWSMHRICYDGYSVSTACNWGDRLCDWREIPEEGRGQMREEILRKR